MQGYIFSKIKGMHTCVYEKLKTNKQKENELHIWHCQIYQNTRALHAFAVGVGDRAACLAATATAHRRPVARSSIRHRLFNN